MGEHRFYMQLVGIFLWIVVHLGRVDIAFAVSSLSRFSAMPRIQHLVDLCKIWGYLTKFPDKRLDVRVEPPEAIPGKIMSRGNQSFIPRAKRATHLHPYIF